MSIENNQAWPPEDFSGWYNTAIRQADLIAESPTRGVWTLLPRTTTVWNSIRTEMTDGMRKIGVGEVVMPTLFPMSLLEKEADHVEGFAPEVFTVTQAGSKVLEDPLVVRPTSEVVASELMRTMIGSYRDLPCMFHQWASAFRAEKRPRPFLRTTEFLWQEGYSAHPSSDDADKHARLMSDFYAKFMEDHLSIASIAGSKSDNERFPGAVATYALEAQLGGRSLQLATSHNLGKGFAESHNIKFVDTDSLEKPVYLTSWGSSTRLIGALVMAHGDQQGIVFPPQVAPEPVTIIPAWRNEADKSTVEQFAKNLLPELGTGATIARRDVGTRLGPVRYEVDKGGSPVQIVVGQREINSGVLEYKLRHSGEKGRIGVEQIGTEIAGLNDRVAAEMLKASRAMLASSIVEVDGDRKALVDAANDGKMALTGWSGTRDDEQRFKAETGITIRVHPHNEPDRRDPLTGKVGKSAIFAKSY